MMPKDAPDPHDPLHRRITEADFIPDVVLPPARIKLTLGQVAVIIIFIVGLGVSWGVTQNELKANREIIQRIEERTQRFEETVQMIREHQIINETIIDRHGEEINAIKQQLGLDGYEKPRRSAREGPKKPVK